MTEAVSRLDDIGRVDVSVIVPSYNSASFIEAAIRSIFSQIGISAEAIVVDDQGTDNTREILRALQPEYNALRVITRPPAGGQATARNEGMAAAVGRYIAFLDSDDVFDGPGVLARWAAHADQHRLDISCAQFRVVQADGAVQPGRSVAPTGDVTTVSASPHLVNVTSCWQLLYRTEFLRRHNLSFCSRLRQREDRLFFIDALLAAERVGVTSLSAVRHLIHSASSFRQINLDQLKQFNIHLHEMVEVHRRYTSAGRLSPSFAAANAHSYWRMLFTYWAPFVLHCLADVSNEAAGHGSSNAPEAAAALELLSLMRALSDGLAPFYNEDILILSRNRPGLTAEAVLDIARLALVAGRYDLLTRLLAGNRLFFSETRELLASGAPPWAEEVVCRYAAFHRGTIARPLGTGAPTLPKLSDLVERLVLHVGPPKTGSSALQHTMERNRLRFIEAGVLYPLTGTNRGEGPRRERTDGHARIVARAIRGGANIDSDLALEIQSLGVPIHTLVLSSENILSHRFWDRGDPNGNVVKKVVDALGIKRVEVMALFRRQDSWFDSYYREVIGNPFNKIVSAPEEFFSDLNERGLFDYITLISEIAAPEAVKIVHVDSYEAVRAKGGSVIWALERIGIQNVDLAPIPRALTNESLTDAIAENVRLAKLNSAASRNELASLFEVALRTPALAQSGFRLISAAQSERFEESLAAELRAFDARFSLPAQVRSPPKAQSELLPLLPETVQVLNGIRSVGTQQRATSAPAPLTRTARLRRERQDRPGQAGSALAETPTTRIALLALAVPLIRRFRGAKKARLFATRVLTEKPPS